MINPDESTQLSAARAGDQEAFAQLVEPYRKQLMVHCYRILGSFEDAEDMMQETLVRVWKRLDSFEGRSSLRSWASKRIICTRRPDPATARAIKASQLGGTSSRRMDRWSAGHLPRGAL